jgi:hypothetical protein
MIGDPLGTVAGMALGRPIDGTRRYGVKYMKVQEHG